MNWQMAQRNVDFVFSIVDDEEMKRARQNDNAEVNEYIGEFAWLSR